MHERRDYFFVLSIFVVSDVVVVVVEAAPAPAVSVDVVVVVVVVLVVVVSADGVVGAVCPEVAVVSISVEGVFSLLQAVKRRPVARSAVNRNARVFMR
jgi:hypothetical protein